MCILILEIIYFIGGIYALVTGKMPGIIIGSGWHAEGPQVKQLGILMAATLPIILVLGFIVGIVSGLTGQDLMGLAIVIELLIVIVVAIIVSVRLRAIRQPAIEK